MPHTTTFHTLGAVVLGATVAAGGCAGPAGAHDALVAKRLDLVNDDGAVVARLGIDEDGSAGLFLLGPAGESRAALIHDETQTALYLFDGHGAIRVGVAQFAHGGGGVALHGQGSRGGTVLYMKDGAGSLSFYDEGGQRLRHLAPPATPTAPAPEEGPDR